MCSLNDIKSLRMYDVSSELVKHVLEATNYAMPDDLGVEVAHGVEPFSGHLLNENGHSSCVRIAGPSASLTITAKSCYASYSTDGKVSRVAAGGRAGWIQSWTENNGKDLQLQSHH
ncbi:hypothetical protein DPMN_067442 [Dreissena polymorpha]|uniref:Uncharacterized protein n=1 Tax=Dreissena polymorpha TaxID=45954 RepID=A0A9D4BVU2_DREPO|nr:hypothetical protein DPMN_067442 [Dreissena polymorpha]